VTARTRRKSWTFGRPFQLKGVDRTLPAGDYQVMTDEELIEGLSFPAYRRIATLILVPRAAGSSSVEMFSIDPADLQAAHESDKGTVPAEISQSQKPGSPEQSGSTNGQ
jgi:hypothetical protein